jgi:thymidylate synthase (FAD)
MKLLHQSIELLPQEQNLGEVYKKIELVGRTCYQSESHIGEKPAKDFVDRMIKVQHFSPVEHGTIYLQDSYDVSAIGSYQRCLAYKYEKNPFSRVTDDGHCDIRKVFITTNLRVIAENGWWDDLKNICAPTKYHIKRVTIKCITNRQIANELVRHRAFSFMQESTRFCNYSKEKFGNHLTFIIPSNIQTDDDINQEILNAWKNAEMSYLKVTSEFHARPQDAAQILPLGLKTTIYMTGFLDDSGWKNFMNLRYFESTGPVHPLMKELSTLIYNKMKEEGWIS